MQRCDHHDWTSEAYVDEWVRRQQAEDPTRAERFQLMCDLLPFPYDATVTILDLGAGYGPVSMFILDRYPHATCIGQDGSEPMLNRARKLMRKYGKRFQPHQSDLFEPNWLPKHLGPFDAVVTSSCLHNLRDFQRIGEIYGEVRGRLKPGGVFLNLDLVNAPTTGLEQRYVRAAAARRQRAGTSGTDVAAMVRRGGRSSAAGGTGPFPASLDQHLTALTAAGFEDVDCFWKELRRALFGGYASPGGVR
jgi:tRNA (cmo5U34)-methyltransferase